jgi:hypothetical protein
MSLALPKHIGRPLGVLLSLAALFTVGCKTQPAAQTIPQGTVLPSPIEAVDLSVPSRVTAMTEPVRLRAPRAGWAAFVVRAVPAGISGRPTLRLPAFATSAAAGTVNVYQVLPAPVDFATAAYVRQSGEPGTVRATPRVLLPLAVAADGTIDLASAARDAGRPTLPPGGGPPPGPVLVWIEVKIATAAPAGQTDGACDLLDGPAGEVLGSVPVTLTVPDLSLASAPAMRIAASLDWSAVAAAEPAAFDGVTERLLSRRDPADWPAVAALDRYARLAHEHGCGLSVDCLQPIVKWPPGRAPAIDWANFDAVAGPWLDGSAFGDGRPVGFWPLPDADGLVDFDLAARSQYRAATAAHFQQRGWTAGNACPVVLRSEGAVTEGEAIVLSAEARATVDAGPAVRAMLPVRADQLPMASADNPSLVAAGSAPRLLLRSPGEVRTAPADGRPAATAAVPYLDAADVLHGTGDEQDVRSVAWLAFLRDADLLTCGAPLPSTRSPADAVRADELPWFYPGSWYGIDGPLPTLQLKWLRQAAQDYQVLRLAAAAGDRDAALAVCRLIARPVELGASATPSEASLLGGTIDPHADDATRDLLVDRLVARRHGPGTDNGRTPLDLRTVRWFDAHQRPTPFATGVTWSRNPPADAATGDDDAPAPLGPGNWITARVAVGVYDPATTIDAEPTTRPADADHPATNGDTLHWQTASGWQPHPAPADVPPVPACGVGTTIAAARFDLNQAAPATAPPGNGDAATPPVSLTLVQGTDHQVLPCPLCLPVATCDRLTRPVSLDGDLHDWFDADAAWLDRPLTRMSSRQSVQAGRARPADHPTSIYTGWTDEDWYVAFRVAGVAADGVRSARNFTEYRDGRAWGEDLCELTVQPVYVDDTVGPTLHVVCRTGGESAERQAAGTEEWQPFEGAALRYAATVDPGGVWRGELAVPWASIAPAGRGRPSLLRFNFGQHVHATGESATWAGPVDRSRQSAMAGLLVLRGEPR